MDDKVKAVQERLRDRLSSRFAMGEEALALPVITFEQVVGPPSGAEDLIPRLVAELKSRGYTVATVKLARPTDPVASEGYKSMPDASYRISSGRVYVERMVEQEPGIDEILGAFRGYDVIIGEGFGYAPAPKFLVTEKPNEGFNLGLPNIVGYVSDFDEHALIPHFTAFEVAGIAERIEEVVIRPRKASV